MWKREGWMNPEAAENYARTVDAMVPQRNEILSIISRLAIELGSAS